jgi:DNA modification methylase
MPNRRRKSAAAEPSWQDRIVDSGLADPAELLENPHQWRVHTDRQREALEEVLDRVGWVQRIVVNRRTGRLIDGHLRVATALRKGEPSVPVGWVDLDEEEERLMLAALDPLSAMASTDSGKLTELLAGVRLDEGALRDLVAELAPGDAGGSAKDPDAAPEPAADPWVEPGAVYALGDHRVLCGDATDQGAVLRFLAPAMPVGIAFTDPPYNMDYRSKALGGIANDDLQEAEFVRLILAFTGVMKEALRAGGSYYVCMGAAEFATVIAQLRKVGLGGRPIVWAKPSAGLGQQEYRPQFELLLYGYVKPRGKRVWNAARRESDLWDLDADRGVVARHTEGGGTVLELGTGLLTTRVLLDQEVTGRVILEDGSESDIWRFGRERGKYVHPTQKPVALVQRALRNSSRPGDVVFDPFLGSGTTIIAAELEARVCYGLDLDPVYAQVAIERWQAFTGREAERVS